MQSWVRRWAAGLLLAAGALLRIVLLWRHAKFGGDSLLYADLAHNMVAHHIFGFTEDSGIRATLIRLPGYPLFLAACFAIFGANNFVGVLWVQVAIGLVQCCLLGALAARLMGSRAGLWALGLAALCPFTAAYDAAPLTEACTLFCVGLAYFSLERWIAAWRARKPPWRWLLWIAFALVFAIFLRPDQALLAVAVVPAMLWIGLCDEGSFVRRATPAVTVALLIALPLLLWGARNWRVFHVIQPLAPRYANDPGEPVSYGFQRWYRTWAIDWKSTIDVYWTYDGSLLSLGDLPPRAFDNAAQRVETSRIYGEYNALSAASAPVDQEFGKLADERIAAHPARYYLWIPFAKLADMWLRPRTEGMKLPVDWWRWREHPGKSAECAAYALLNLAYLVLAAVGLWRWRRRGWTGHPAIAYSMLSFVMLRNVLLWTVDNSEPRYTLECFPIVIVLASFAAARSRALSVDVEPEA